MPPVLEEEARGRAEPGWCEDGAPPRRSRPPRPASGGGAPAADGGAARAGAGSLRGTPRLPFACRYLLTFEAASQVSSWVIVGMSLAVAARLPLPEQQGLRRAAWPFTALGLADLAWRRLHKAGWCRWRVVVPLAFVALDFPITHGGAARGVLNQFSAGPPGALGTAFLIVLFVVASRVTTTACLWSQMQRISWTLPATTLMVFHIISSNADTCSSSALAGSAAAERATRLLAAALRLVSSVPGPPPPCDAPLALPSTAEECRTVLAYLQLTLGLVVPAVVLARLEARLYAQHAEQRRREGLPAERGWWHPRLYAALQAANQQVDWVTGAALAWAASAALHAVAGAVAHAQAGA